MGLFYIYSNKEGAGAMNEMNVQEKRQKDSWEEVFPREAEDALIQNVMEMEENSEWIPGITAKDIRLESLDDRPLFLDSQIQYYHLDNFSLAEDTALYGTRLLIYTGTRAHQNGRMYELVRDTAVSGLHRVARLNGNSLGQMTREKYCETMNNGFETAKGTALGLIRYGKLSGLHSGSDGGYMTMPISRLLDITADTVTRRFGTAVMAGGYNSHGFTKAMWELPNAQNRLIDMYQKALYESGNSTLYAVNFMPGVDFYSSDTAASAASLDPVFFKPNGTPMRFIEGIKVKHLRRGDAKDKDGLILFAEGADNIFAKFEDTAKVIAKLAGIKIRNPENCCIRLCNRYHISPKYGQAALEEIERIAMGEMYITAHDLYIGMTEVLSEAERCDASRKVITKLEESLAKIVRTDFSEDDVSGTVAWGQVQTAA